MTRLFNQPDTPAPVLPDPPATIEIDESDTSRSAAARRRSARGGIRSTILTGDVTPLSPNTGRRGLLG